MRQIGVIAVSAILVGITPWEGRGAAAAETEAAAGGGLLIDYNTFTRRFCEGNVDFRAAFVEDRGDWGYGFFLRTPGVPGGIGRLDPATFGPTKRYDGPPMYGGMSVVFPGDGVTLKEGSFTQRRIGPDAGFDVALSFTVAPGPAPTGRAGLVWYVEREGGPFDLTSRTRFAFRADPLLPFSYQYRCLCGWLIVDREGGLYVSNEAFELCRSVGLYRCESGDPTALHWARADFSGPDLTRTRLDFGGRQPGFSGVRGAGIFATCEAAGLKAGELCSIWMISKYFLLGDADAVARAVAAAPPPAGEGKKLEAVPLYRDGMAPPPRTLPLAAGAGPTPPKPGPGPTTGTVPVGMTKGKAVAGGGGRSGKPDLQRWPAGGKRAVAVVVVGYGLVGLGTAMLAFVAWSVWRRLGNDRS